MLLPQIRHRCKEVENLLTAKEQQRYMQSAMPYWGVKTPELQKIYRSAFNDHPPKDNIEYC